MAKIKEVFKNKKGIFLYALLFLFTFFLIRAKIVGSISPFGYAFAFACVYLNKNPFLIATSYFAFYCLLNFSFIGLIEGISTFSALLLLYLIFKIFKRKINLATTLIFVLLSQTAYVYFHLSSMSEIFVTTASLVVGVLFCYVCISSLGAIFSRGISGRKTIDEYICLSLLLIAFFCGLSNIYLFSINISSCLALLMVLVVSRCFTRLTTIILGVLYGFGVAFANSNLICVAIFAVFGIISAILSKKQRVFSAISILLADLMFGLFLNAYAYYSYLNIVSIFLVLVIYLCIPTKILNFIAGFSSDYEGSLAEEYILLGQKDNLRKNLKRISKCFSQMQVAYRTLSVGELNHDGASETLAVTLKESVCATCPKFNICESNEKINESKVKLIDFALEKGKASFIDASNLLTANCICLSSIIEEVNALKDTYYEYEKTIKTGDKSKMTLSEQCSATADILDSLATDVVSGEGVNISKSNSLLDELSLNNIIVNEARVLESDEGITRIILVVQNRDVLSEKILSCAKNVLKLSFEINVRQMTRLAGWSVVCLVPCQRYDVLIGFASSSKDNISGDTYSILKLPSKKRLFAIADGMGHGKRANQISSSVLSLIENFFSAGFKESLIASSVNRVMLNNIDENFTCLDAAVVNTMDGTCDFIKLGASVSLIKSKNTTKVISCDSLPIGIVKNMTAKMKKEVLNEEDVIVLASDGVVDRFLSVEEYSNFVNNETTTNVNMLANIILEEASARPTDHEDDMTVITIKLVRK